MSLHPIISIASSPDPIAVPPGNLMTAAIDMTTRTMMQIALAQLSSTQDYSLRAWLSVWPDGVPIEPGNFPILRGAMLPVIIHTAGQTPVENAIVIPVAPGQYVLNILNLTNEQNIMTFEISYG